jgi:hypothetical protein
MARLATLKGLPCGGGLTSERPALGPAMLFFGCPPDQDFVHAAELKDLG